MNILHVVGARPNFIKVAPVIDALAGCDGVRQVLVHTGQHYDPAMSEIFFRQLGIPEPDYNLEVGSGTHAVQTAEIMCRFEPVLLECRPDLVLVYGDVNSTLAASLVCAKLLVPVGHVEAGLRSFDLRMPEEINRIVTDRLASILFTPSSDADRNLLKEGVVAERIKLVGNVMIDTLMRLLPRANRLELLRELSIENRRYVLVTLHRPSNVDNPEQLHDILRALSDIAAAADVIFPVHPRTRQVMSTLRDLQVNRRVHFIDPVGYLEFLSLQHKALLVITDSGGIQEETTYLGVPCLTVRENTERPVTVEIGSNVLVGRDMTRMREEAAQVLAGSARKGTIPPLWDGKTGLRIAGIITGSTA